ncbi:extensin family protein [Enterovirga aerilata]|uniref:Extensin n=1 Tax=Enterovirga aerilata TaxID=2730920 RepID=A0A849I0G1_9HYPH|nr:extensin family protein [Enterovirga sp. DB1703]NNM71054.1 extensin [Enterovirga sp. DB1703]
MRRGYVAFLALTLVGVALVGCGRFGFEQREAWRTQAEEACLAAKLVTPTAYMSRASEIDGPGACGISYPFKVAALADGTVGLSNRLTLGCPIIPEIDAWLNGTVQPAAELYFGTSVAEIRAGSYSCRGRNNRVGAKLSEHAFGNAVDIMSFKLADGRTISVEKGWKGAPDEQDFLREAFVGACRHFTTVLAPGSDIYHYNHFHLDLARHDPRGRRRVCKPMIKFEPRLDPDRAADVPVARPRPAVRPLPQPAEPLEIEDEGEDPYAVSEALPRHGPGPQSRAAASPPPPASRAAAYEMAAPSRAAAAPRQDGPAYRGPAPAPHRDPYAPPAGAPGRPAGAPLVLQPQLHRGTAIY